jgi:hypothetical protein
MTPAALDASPADLAARAALARAQAGELLGPADMAAIWRIGPTQFTKLRKQGAFNRFMVKNPIGRCCFSGTLVYRHVCGEAEYVPTFGRRAAR